eukprot:m.511217 g.511217  ORF g.511217 m.511217 type:complete len:60 (+) comp57425_c0_seq27:765-944(+)
MKAVAGGRIDCFRVLLGAGADPSIPDLAGNLLVSVVLMTSKTFAPNSTCKSSLASILAV